MSSIRTFCVRWLTMIVIVSGIAIPVSRTVADLNSPPAAAGQEATAER
jgi:hypothetical protein